MGHDNGLPGPEKDESEWNDYVEGSLRHIRAQVDAAVVMLNSALGELTALIMDINRHNQ